MTHTVSRPKRFGVPRAARFSCALTLAAALAAASLANHALAQDQLDEKVLELLQEKEQAAAPGAADAGAKDAANAAAEAAAAASNGAGAATATAPQAAPTPPATETSTETPKEAAAEPAPPPPPPAPPPAPQVQSIDPVGSVASAAQVRVKFSQDMVPFGQPEAAAPVQVRCEGGFGETGKGEGRWVDARQWVFDFERRLSSGVRCSVAPDAAFRDLNGQTLKMAQAHHFDTGAPALADIQPSGNALDKDVAWNQIERWGWEAEIDEEQQFLLSFDSPVDVASLQAAAYCEASDVGERIPVRVLDEAERKALVDAVRDSHHAHYDTYDFELDEGESEEGEKGRQRSQRPVERVALVCQRRFSPGVAMKLVLGAGLKAPNGLGTTQPQIHVYHVREPFKANFTCQRENAEKKCIPVLPVVVNFSAAMDMRWLEQIQLRDARDGRIWQGKGEHTLDYGDEELTSVAQWKEKPLEGRLFNSVRFEPPFPPNAELEVVVPPELKDDSGRPLANANAFPLKVGTEDMPALAKFSTGNFAVIERFAEGYDAPALLPVTLRSVEAPLPLKVLKLESDADILEWLWRVEKFSPDQYHINVSLTNQLGFTNLPGTDDDGRYVQGRMISLLDKAAGVREMTIPARAENAARRETEVVGVPLEPGFQVVELASPVLGQALLDENLTGQRVLHARTAVLVTNLMVHFKHGQENAIAWVTELDTGKPVAGARVKVNRCDAQVIAEGVTDAQGVVQLGKIPAESECIRPVSNNRDRSYLITARTDGGDLGLVRSDWSKGIENWRFGVPVRYRYSEERDDILHTVLDRSLLRAGETVSMKHYARRTVMQGFAEPDLERLPKEVEVMHGGSGRKQTLALNWQRDGSGGVFATSTLTLAPLAELGNYYVRPRGNHYYPHTAQFRVEEFRLPVLKGSIAPTQQDAAQATPDTLPMQMQLDYISGGAAANWPVKISAIIESRYLNFPGYDRFTFEAPQRFAEDGSERKSFGQRLLLDKKPLQLDAQGRGQFALEGLNKGASDRPRDVRVEATYEDPSGEMQTLTHIQPIWPTAAVVGIRTDHWISVKKPLAVRTVALDPQGKPVNGAAIKVTAREHTTLTTRKRMVGGFYRYEHHNETRDLGVICEGKSDTSGVFDCMGKLENPGRLELVAQVTDGAGRSFESGTFVWVTRAGEMWFDADASDRMDVLPEKPSYQPGETARFQVRMPYRKAQALVSIEREGVIDTRVMELAGNDPSFTLQIDKSWGPNVYVSVLAVRGRLRDVPWYSFFTWGWRSPIVWWNAWRSDTGEAVPPTAMVDLSKPSYRLGVASVRVGDAAHRMAVQVAADKARYATGDKAVLNIEAKLPDGKPAAGADVALAVVDKALLELAPNPSWDLLQAMMQPRPWAVHTATAQMEVVGRRHYGLKARAEGGGGGGDEGDGATRELFDTLLLWQPTVTLDANGRAQVEVPINDSVTTFHAEAIATSGLQFFGSGSGEITVTQDLQLISGLPPVVRAGDVYEARVTVRNTTASAFTAELGGQHDDQALETRRVEVPAGSAQTVQWRVTAPPLAARTVGNEAEIVWNITATAGEMKDAIRIPQKLLPVIPVTVRQSTLRQVSEPVTMQAAMPHGALEGDGGLHVDAQASLAGDVLPGLRHWWRDYPYVCLEQRHSKALGLLDEDLFKELMADLPRYLDRDGLAGYFVDSSGYHGHIALTAHILAVDGTMGLLGEQTLRIGQAERETMLKALAGVAEGRIKRNNAYAPTRDNTVQQLAVVAALALHGQAAPAMLEPIQINLRRLPTHALLDWMLILKQLQGIPNQASQMQLAQQELRSRLVHTGVQVLFTTESQDDWWWVMQGANANAARLLLITTDLPGWREDSAGLVAALMARQKDGHWGTTTANIWAQLALRRFAQVHESQPVAGTLRVRFAGQEQEKVWPAQAPATGTARASAPVNTSREKLNMAFAWPDAIARVGDANAAAQLHIEQMGSGAPWVTISALAAVPITEPVASGIRVEKTITPLSQATPGQWSVGDIYRVRLVLHTNAEVGMTALTDPIPAGSTILGSGLGRDSSIAVESGDDGQRNTWGVAWQERKMDVMRVYYNYLPKGTVQYSYTVRLNQPGEFKLPPTRAEALYMPQVFGETPNEGVAVVVQR